MGLTGVELISGFMYRVSSDIRHARGGSFGVSDVLGLRTRNADAEPVRVLPVRALDCVRVLMPDDNVVNSGFHDVTFVDMSVAHASLRGKFMASLRCFTIRACTDDKWAAKRDQIQGTRLQRCRAHRLRYLEVIDPGDRTTSIRLAKLLGWCPGHTRSVDKGRVINDHLVSHVLCQHSYVLCPFSAKAVVGTLR